MAEHENILGAKNEVAAKPKTRVLPSNPDEEKSAGMKELATEQKNENGKNIEEAGKPKAGFTPTDQDDEKSKELKEAVTE